MYSIFTATLNQRWLQATQKTTLNFTNNYKYPLQPSHLHDDVLGVVNHLEQLTTLLSLEARAREIHSATSPAECLEFLLSENLLDKLYEWATLTGKWVLKIGFYL